MLRFGSSEWCAAAADLFAPVAIAPASGCRVQFDAGDARWYLVVEGGRVTQFETGDLDAPDIELRWTHENADAIWRRRLRDDDAMRATTVVAPVDDGVYTGPPTPGDLLARPELQELPQVPGASVVAQYRFEGGPFGTVHHSLTFVDGRCTADAFGVIEPRDVFVGVRYGAIPLVRSGDATILEALEGGTVEGEIGPLATLAGILESPEFRAAELATGPYAYALAVLGELDTNEEWAAALDRLATETAA